MLQKQRIIFTMLMAPLTVFRKSTIRSRTSLSDFSLNQLRGICEDGSWRVTTLYTVADAVKSSGFMSRFLIDMLIAHNLRPRSEEGPFALAFVLDDFERLPKLSKLAAGLTQEDVNLITEEPGYVLKFKTVELWERLRAALEG